MSKKIGLDNATINLAKRVLALPPKQQTDMKVGRPVNKKKRGTKARASSSKQRNA